METRIGKYKKIHLNFISSFAAIKNGKKSFNFIEILRNLGKKLTRESL